LKFILLKEGSSGPSSYALILNPYKVIAHHHEHKHPGLRGDKWNALMERMSEIGDESLTPPPPPAAAPVAAAPLPVAPATAPAPTEAQPAVANPTLLNAG
jgi:hypothetical protein